MHRRPGPKNGASRRSWVPVLQRTASRCAAPGTRGLSTRAHRQLFERAHAGPRAPAKLRVIHRERQLWPTAEQGFQRTGALDAGELVAEAEVDAGAECHVPVRPAVEGEALRIG